MSRGAVGRPTAARLWPPALAPGARVALVAPSGPLLGEADVARAVDNARSLGWEPRVGAHVLGRAGYLAGSDADRLADLDDAFRDPAVDGVWCLRGGYGAMRLLDHVDYDAIARRPRALLGYSDITALHCAVASRAGLVTFHGPVARASLPPFARRSLRAAVVSHEQPCGEAPAARPLRPGTAEGLLAGGNLALLAALAGTPYAPDLRGTILVLEDVGEAVYRVDRMLQQLRLSGMLGGVRALVFGQCTDCPDGAGAGVRTLDDVLTELADDLSIPCLAGLPVGHIDDQWTLPLGALATLDVSARRLDVEMPVATPAGSGNAVARLAPTHPDRPTPEDFMTPKSGTDLINEAKTRIREVTPKDVQGMLAEKRDVVLLDVREPNEWNLGHLPGAVHIPRGTLEGKVEQQLPREREIVVYCAGGSRSALAADTMRQMGYENVASMSGGWREWVGSGGAVEG